ncbi:aromatic ring-hydroxylating dioxygenase subunit alpha [Aetokthonos hydrillicola Thurmond2011]|jgi:phenylpropionate dioxygenase-like ring-hydroxylating dioxygenase large terminal subunit|uniref:Aromatic ring-hydroxylating dioxygenase subunit alpha n=1 Tax=Aetokthonos hydrillicola Thurmond2011 TaxID=2712845 RepID=A0AAP5I6R2_9CYAN|nr:aromatic ring-hydroxylating dioxygenase subunit alpha [Aetokthonos hydrillicola]MBO3463343.1 aromatic ring-hydroxylating dioxygenase subunit alpha [Aetokthonos hydrillicola CCALA 1050]MBW4589558.1 aromatic ring-hydroxylating dioxygenase subunit alpha [Aetokthonos hydrillicola CCALA 1050]MDR9896017.1 aromatic ring-hydroxylating dioxygenase subunit alpha [Aetokthonos hydrillicola Thurmond2011]
MELATTLIGQTVQNAVRQVGINANYWYAVGWSNQLRTGSIMKVVIWQQGIAVYRDDNGHLQALEDVCPHKGVELHKGKVQGCNLACAYHGWEFNPEGHCVGIPYLPKEQKLPRAQARSYPIQEKYDLIWIFPGDPALAAISQPPDIAEFDEPDWFMVPVPAKIKAHFTICNENSMDVFHGFLHQKLQGWFDPVLISLRETDTSVRTEYKVSYKGRMAKFLGLSEHANQVTTLPVSTEYRYPHFYSSLQGISTLYLMRLPVGPTETHSIAFFFFKIRLPKWLLQLLKPVLQILLQRLVLLRFLAQDIEMVESEQQTYLGNPNRRYVEINPAIIAVQRLAIRQYEQYVQQSSQQQNNPSRNRKPEKSISISEAIVPDISDIT